MMSSMANGVSCSGFINAPNKVPEHQRAYQAAYRAHTRIWRIVSWGKFPNSRIARLTTHRRTPEATSC